MTPFRLTDELVDRIGRLVEQRKGAALLGMLGDLHHADIAEIVDELDLEGATYLIKLLDSGKTSDVLTELDDDVRERILGNLSVSEIAREVEALDTDDAADIINGLPDDRRQQVIDRIEDQGHARDIVELLRYDEGSAGGPMAKELVRVNENWNVLRCVTEMRRQAESVARVHSIYVVDDDDRLKGRLSLKDLLTTSTRARVRDVCIPKVDDPAEEVARVMSKYDLEAIPVVDGLGRLVGRVTIDDIVDVIKEGAGKDYQLAAGITQEVEADDSIWEPTKARPPWLVLGLPGGLGSVFIMEGYQEALGRYKELFFFTPLIAAMAGNVGVQSSAIVVQGLANDTVRGSLLNRLLKEVGLSLISGATLGTLVVVFGHLSGLDPKFSLTIAFSMLCVIVVAALVGTFVPIILDRRGIDPAIATGPFITTSNDIFGILLFFMISKYMLGL